MIPVLMFHDLLERRFFDAARLWDRWYLVVVDGSVKEECRQGFVEGGKSSTNGIGLEHVFCAQANASKNYYTMMQVAQILWLLTCRGCLQRLYDWAQHATELGLARALWEGLRAARLPPDLPPLGQIRFSSA
jgi:hypothetical protein